MTSPTVLYHEWRTQLQILWPEEHQARLKTLTWLLVGLYLSSYVHLAKVARKLPGTTQQTSKERRFSRLLNNPKLAVRLLYKPVAVNLLLKAAKKGRPLRLIIDGSKVGNGHQMLLIALAYRRRALPLIWTWRKGVKGHSPVYAQIALFLAVRLLLPDNATVIVSGDSEFGSTQLMRRFERWGWFYVLRQKGRYLLSMDEDEWQRCDSLLTKSGSKCWLTQIYLTKNRHYQCNFLAYWRTGCKEPWLLATNLSDPVSSRLHYSRRMWIEGLFGDCKGSGFDIESTRLQSAGALNRLMLAIAILVVWLLATGARVVKAGQRYLVDRTDRRDLSLFRIGWDTIERRLANNHTISIRLLPYF